MPRAMITLFADCDLVFYEDDPQETAGDDYDCLDDNTCRDPGGHLFKTSCGETKCLHCGFISWT